MWPKDIRSPVSLHKVSFPSLTLYHMDFYNFSQSVLRCFAFADSNEPGQCEKTCHVRGRSKLLRSQNEGLKKRSSFQCIHFSEIVHAV